MNLKLFFRQILSRKMAWGLNVVCLSVAFAVIFIIIKQVRYDFSFDTCYPQSENIYELGYYNVASGKYSSRLSMPVIRQALDPIPEIEAYTVLWCGTDEKTSFYCGETEYANVPFYGVVPGFIQIFQPHILTGNAEEALKTGNGLVIPRSLAEKWFGKKNPVGQSIGFGKKNNLWTIKAVYEDFPENSSMRNAVLLKMNENKDWSEWSYFSFLRTRQGIDKGQLVQKIIAVNDSLSLAANDRISLFSSRYRFELKPIEDVYFNPFSEGLFGKYGNLSMTLSLLAIGILIVLIAYINFINFSTALAPARIKTFNLCQITGASVIQMRKYVIAEAVFLSFIAWCISFFWIGGFAGTSLAKVYFNASLAPWENIGLFFVFGGGALLLGALAGIYPAFYMTSFSPALVLKGSFALNKSGRCLRKGLLVFQFTGTVVLIIASLFVLIQHHYLRNLSWGYPTENVIYASTTKMIEKSPMAFRSELLKNPNVLDITASRFIPGSVPMGWGRYYMDSLFVNFFAWPVEPDFLSFFNIPLYEGDTLRQPPEGKDYLIFNRSMVEKFRLQNSMGKEVFKAFRNPVTVIGFAENVNFQSLHHKIEPMAFICGDDMWNEYVFVKVRPEQIHETIEYVKTCFAKYGNEEPDITFLDDYINDLYSKEENLSWLISLFCIITVIISLAGIYGLILFNIRYKIKETGIRKINGASGAQILWNLNGIFIRLVLWGFVIAVPIALVVVKSWLKNYPYRTPVYWWVFIGALLITLAVTLITVTYQSWKAANANPVDSVKTE